MADFPRGLEMLDRSMRVHEELGNRRAYATALGNRASIYEAAGQFTDCVASAGQALRLRLLAGDRTLARAPLHYLAEGLARLGRPAEALRYRRRALLAAIEIGDTGTIAVALNNIQRLKRELGLTSPAMAGRYLAAALRLAQRSGHRGAEAEILNSQAVLLRDLGRYAEATGLHETAIAMMRQTAEQQFEAIYLNDLAITSARAGDRAEAVTLHRRALRLARAHGLTYVVACAEAGIADCLADCDPEQARRSWTAALAAFRAMGVPEQYEVERRLAAVPA
jgi:tetratricopeptide (TPR) repeat protein